MPPPRISTAQIQALVARLSPDQAARFLPGGVGSICSIFQEGGKWVMRDELTGETLAEGESFDDVRNGAGLESLTLLPGETPEDALQRFLSDRRGDKH